MKNKIINVIVVTLFFSLFTFGQNDWKEFKLKANVESIKIIDYNVVEHFGEIKKTDIVSGENYLFNESGFITIKKSYGVNGTPLDQSRYEYNTNNNIIVQNVSDKEGKLMGKITSEYNEMYKKTYESVYQFDGTLQSRSAYSYIKHIKLKEIVTYDSSGEKMNLKVYDYHKRKLTKVETTINPKSKVKSSRKKYDKYGNLVESIFYDVMGDVKTNLLFKYDDNGNLIESQYFDKENLTTKRILKHNNLGFLVEEKVSYPLIDKMDIITYSYTFDKNVNWIQMIKYVNSIPVNMKERNIVYFQLNP